MAGGLLLGQRVGPCNVHRQFFSRARARGGGGGLTSQDQALARRSCSLDRECYFILIRSHETEGSGEDVRIGGAQCVVPGGPDLM